MTDKEKTALVKEHHRLLRNNALYWSRRLPYTVRDLYNEGVICLLEAIEEWDKDKAGLKTWTQRRMTFKMNNILHKHWVDNKRTLRVEDEELESFPDREDEKTTRLLELLALLSKASANTKKVAEWIINKDTNYNERQTLGRIRTVLHDAGWKKAEVDTVITEMRTLLRELDK